MGRGVCRGGGVKKTAGKCVQIRKGGAREPENPCRDNGTVPGGGENGSVQRAGASAEEKGDPSAWKRSWCVVRGSMGRAEVSGAKGALCMPARSVLV